jgi:hypothetical protein
MAANIKKTFLYFEGSIIMGFVMKAAKFVILLSIIGMICSLGCAQPSGHETSRSAGAMYTSSHHPSNYDWLSTGYYRYPYYRYNYYPYYYPYSYYPYYYSYYPYSYYYGYPWYWYT